MLLVRKKKLTIWQVLGSIGAGLFIGCISAIWCFMHAPEKAPIIIPLATSLGEKIMLALLVLDYKALAKGLLQSVVDKLK